MNDLSSIFYYSNIAGLALRFNTPYTPITMFKELLLKKLIKSKLGDLPAGEQDKIIRIVTKNPELFQEIAVKIKKEMNSGKDQMAATMSVMKEYQGQIQKLMSEEA